ncbi:MAG: class I SAM-dependent methyltransferase [Alcanivoracaceae bacterium]|nr:class I SAM-dependent methyltransferase [Alcanivoracaceae bacterium]
MKLAALPGTPDVGALSVMDEEAAAQAGVDMLLGVNDGRLALWRPEGHETPLCVDFDGGQLGYRLAADRVRHERLVRAAGKISDNGVLVDATAGLGRDSALLARAGWQVTMLERQPVLQALLADGLARSRELAGQMALVAEDSVVWLTEHPRIAEVVYLDPMFPERDKSAAIKKELLWLQWLCGSDSAASEERLLQAALTAARRRVVVKRPLRAPPLAGHTPASSLTGKTVRFDIYPCHAA